MINVRLSEEEENALKRYCLHTGLSKSIVVKEALAVYLNHKRMSQSAYQSGQDLFGVEGSGSSNRSASYKKLLKKKLNEKHAR